MNSVTSSPAPTTESPGSSRSVSPMSELNLDSVSSTSTICLSTSKTKEIAIAILFGVAALAGAAVLTVGTVATFGTLPFFLILGATAVSAIVSAVSIYLAARGEQDLCAYFDQGTKDKRSYVERGAMKLHPQFVKDCVCDRSRGTIDGMSFAERFPDEHAKMAELKQAALQYQDDPDRLEAIEIAESSLKASYQEKIIDEFARIVSEKLGENSPAISSISAAFCQNSEILLNNEIRRLGEIEYDGQLTNSGLKPKNEFKYSLELPSDGKLAAKITVVSNGEFSSLVRSKGGDIVELEPPCGYKATATIVIDLKGRSTVETDVQLGN